MLKTACLVVAGTSVAAMAGADVCSPATSAPARAAYLLTSFYGPAGIGLCTNTPSDALFTSVNLGLTTFQQHFTTPLTTDLAGTVASLPVPSAASGFTYAYDPTSGVFRRSTQSFGPILADRAETVGKGRISVGLAYEHFKFVRSEFDIEASSGIDAGGDTLLASRVTTIDIGQLVGFVNYAPVERLDVSLALPFTRAELNLAGGAQLVRPDPVPPSYDPGRHYFPGRVESRTFAASRTTSGLGDLTLRFKFSVIRSGRRAVAVGTDLRLPTGEALDLLGSGAFGVRPFAVLSYANRVISPHLKVGYDWGGKSVLGGEIVSDGQGGAVFTGKGPLPNKLLMHAGVDIALHPRATLAVDFLGSIALKHYALRNGVYGRSTAGDGDVSVGLKLNPLGRLLVDLNLLFYNPHDFTFPSPHPSALLGLEYGF